MKNPLFYAKILLFGEYGIIENGKGLTLPYNFYKGSLKFSSSVGDEFQTKSNLSLKKWFSFLKTVELPKKFALKLASP